MNPPSDNPVARFGAFIRARRNVLNLTARSVADASGLKPSNLCNLELGVTKPPQDSTRLKQLAVALELDMGTNEFTQFADLAAKANNSIPLDIAAIITEDEAIPLLLRSLGNQKLKKTDVLRIVALVRSQTT